MHFLVLYTFASERDKALLFLGSDPDSAEVRSESGKERGDERERKEEASSMPTWLYFLHNGCVLLFSVWEAVEFGLVSEVAASWDIPIPVSASESPHTLSLLSYFDTLIPRPTITTDFISNGDHNAIWDEGVIAAYKEAAVSLASALTIAFHPPFSSTPAEFASNSSPLGSPSASGQ
jgi:hypothetical protein